MGKALDAVYQCPKCKTVKGHDFRYEGLIPHDMRRSAAKALRRAGVPESVIMATGGWKTAAMFRRYAIVSSADSRDAMEMLERARAQRAAASAAERPSLPDSGHIAERGIKPN
jgi:integrase